jgi:hypothetical protein
MPNMQSLLLFATAALALATRQNTPGELIAADILVINSSLTDLAVAINDFQTAAQADALISASRAVVAALDKGAADADASPVLADNDVAPFVEQLVGLSPVVNATIGTLIDKRDVFADSGRGCEVHPQLEDQLTAVLAFNKSLIAKTPESLLIVAIYIADPIVASLHLGLAAFEDVECAGTPTSTAASSTAGPTDTAIATATTTGTATATATLSQTSAAQTGDASSTSVTSSVTATATGTDTTGSAATTTATGSQGSAAVTVTTLQSDVTETVPCTTATAAQPSSVTTTLETDVTETVPCTTTFSAVASSSGAASGTGSGTGGADIITPSPSPSLVIAGVSRRGIPVVAAVAALVGALGIVL